MDMGPNRRACVSIIQLYTFCGHRAIFAFSCEAFEDRRPEEEEEAAGTHTEQESCPGYRIMPSGRYAHSRRYIEGVAVAHGWRVVHCSGEIIRYNAGEPVHGYLCVLELTV